jgi:hypothetical protein
LSNVEDPEKPEPPYPRVVALRQMMREYGLEAMPIFMAGGVWYLREWQDWIENPELGPIAFQFGTRALLTEESPIPQGWKDRLLHLEEGDISLNRWSPTGFYSSAVRNEFVKELEERNARQVAYAVEPVGQHDTLFPFGPRRRTIYLTAADKKRAEKWIAEGYDTTLKTPDSTIIFVTLEKREEIRRDQVNCMGCLSACRFSNWACNDSGTTGKKTDPRTYCIQKTLQSIVHDGDVETQLMFAGHSAYRFRDDPFYANGFIPTVRQLVERIQTGD